MLGRVSSALSPSCSALLHADLPYAVCVSQFHPYEGHPIQETVFPVRVLKLLGVEKLISPSIPPPWRRPCRPPRSSLSSRADYRPFPCPFLTIVTNAAGGLNPAHPVGTSTAPSCYPRFISMTQAHPPSDFLLRPYSHCRQRPLLPPWPRRVQPSHGSYPSQAIRHAVRAHVRGLLVRDAEGQSICLSHQPLSSSHLVLTPSSLLALVQCHDRLRSRPPTSSLSPGKPVRLASIPLS